MAKPVLSTFVAPVLKRVANPVVLCRAAWMEMRRKSVVKRDDAQLGFYADLLPGDFLHYGYFEQIDQEPLEMRVNDIIRAQNRYAELLIERPNADRSAPVLDVGCGMGGLIRMLLGAGFAPVALSPDRSQVANVRAKYPEVPAICAKFEDLDLEEHAQRYSTVFTSESLQYLRLPRALPVMERILRPGGTWVACDYFNRDAGNPARRLPAWPDFQRVVADAGWRFSSVRDITANVIPTLQYIHMWASRAGLPVLRFLVQKLNHKHPGLHYLLGSLLPLLQKSAEENIRTVCPDEFARKKQYMLFTLER